jgi:hypothetical protein
MFLSPEEIATHLMLYRLTASAMVEIPKVSLDDFLTLVFSNVGHDIRSTYNLWDTANPYTEYDPNTHDSVAENPKHPHNVTREILTIVWKRLQ